MKSLTKRDHPLHVARYKHGHFEYGTKDPRAAAMQFGGIISRKWRRKGYSILFPARRVIDMTRLQQREMFFALYNELNNHFVNLAFKAGFRIPYHNRPTV